MPLIPLEHNYPDVHLGIWKVEEDEKFFLDRLNIYPNEKEHLAKITHPAKKLEWLSSRLCLKELLHISHKVESLNEQNGKPYLSDRSFNISYTHSNLYSGAIASTVHNVSIDLEDYHKIRNLDARFLFMNPEELTYFEKHKDTRVFFLIWSGKETLYKIYPNKGLIFKKNLFIQLNPENIKPSGVIPGIIEVNGKRKKYDIHYTFFEHILLTYTVELSVV